MTDRQFVRSIYPGANCKPTKSKFAHIQKFVIYDIRCRFSNYDYNPLAWGKSSKDAWANASTVIQLEMLRKLES